MRKPDKSRFINSVKRLPVDGVPFQENDPDILM